MDQVSHCKNFNDCYSVLNSQRKLLYQPFLSTSQGNAIYHVFKTADGNVPVAKFISVSEYSLQYFPNLFSLTYILTSTVSSQVEID